MTDLQLYTKLSSLPLNLQNEVADFIDFLKNKSQKEKENSSKRIAGKAKGMIEMKDNLSKSKERYEYYICNHFSFLLIQILQQIDYQIHPIIHHNLILKIYLLYLIHNQKFQADVIHMVLHLHLLMNEIQIIP